MRNSLTNKLTEWIQQEGKMTYQEVSWACWVGRNGRFGRKYKLETATRRLRELTEERHPRYNPNITILEERGIVIGWAWNGVVPEKKIPYDDGDRVVMVPESLLPSFLNKYPLARKLTIN